MWPAQTVHASQGKPPIPKNLRLAGLKAVSFYMSEADSALRARLKQVHDPPVLSSDCLKIMKIERALFDISSIIVCQTG